VILPPAVLQRGLRLVAPGQPLPERFRAALALPGLVRADAAQGRAAVAGLRGDGERRIAVFGDRPLDPTADSASHRLGWLLRLAIADGWRVSFHSVRQRRWFDVDGELRLTPAETPQSARVAWVVRPEAAAAVMPSLASLRPRLRIVYDSMDLHHLRLERESAVTGSRGLAVQARLMKELERQASSRADVAVAISEQEAPLLRRLAGNAEVAVLPNVHQARDDEPPPLAARSGLLFVGNFTHTPNVDAVETLARDVMPRLWERRPELVLSVAGRGLEPGRFDERIRVLGFVDDLDALVDRSAVLVAPLRFGAGLKGKVGYALARGLPVVTTPVGAEGFAEPAVMVVVPRGDWRAFADSTLELIADAEVWSRTSAAGLELTRREYSPDVLAERLRRILEP
jgi:O-antigen biosynthesis protein